VRIKCPKCGTVHLAETPAVRPGTPAPSEPAMPGSQLRRLLRRLADRLCWSLTTARSLRHDPWGAEEGGFVTEYAPNGLEALRKASELKPVAMIVDVGLTGIYGFELCERLKGDPGPGTSRSCCSSSVLRLTA